MDKTQFLIEMHLRTKRPIKELALEHGVDRSWLYRVLKRYRLEGNSGLVPRSRRPLHSPSRISDLYEDEIVALRKELLDRGFDGGAVTLHTHLCRRHNDVPSVSTIWRVLKARGFVSRQPHKRPKNSYKRFVADFPNECWQADVTHVAGVGGLVFEVLNIIDDHSRVCIESRAFVSTRSADVVRALHRAAARWGYPQSFLTDNGPIFTASERGGDSAMETELLSLGIKSKHGKPYHPQTQGKVERFHQTLKRYLAKQEPANSTKQLQRQLDRFAEYYNTIRPHRSLGRCTPSEVFAARERAFPTGPIINAAGYRVRRDRVDKSGTVSLRYHGQLYHVGVGRAYTGWRVILLVAGRKIKILGMDGSPLRSLTLDPSVSYQRIP